MADLETPVVIHLVHRRCFCCQEVMCKRRGPHRCEAPLMCIFCADREAEREEQAYDAAWRHENSDEEY